MAYPVWLFVMDLLYLGHVSAMRWWPGILFVIVEDLISTVTLTGLCRFPRRRHKPTDTSPASHICRYSVLLSYLTPGPCAASESPCLVCGPVSIVCISGSQLVTVTTTDEWSVLRQLLLHSHLGLQWCIYGRQSTQWSWLVTFAAVICLRSTSSNAECVVVVNVSRA